MRSSTGRRRTPPELRPRPPPSGPPVLTGTYLAALVTVGVSLLVGGAVIALSGRREWSWSAPAVGLAVIVALAWVAVRLPGEGWAVLAALALLCSAALLAVGRAGGSGSDAAFRIGAPVLLGALLLGSLPFIFEQRFGILGTGFNVDVSQHLFAADRLAGGDAQGSSLVTQGYPVGPHSLVAGLAELPGANLVTAFSGLTIAIGAIASLTALGGLGQVPVALRVPAAIVVGLAYLVASYVAQGSFKEVLIACLVLGFALAMRELGERREASADDETHGRSTTRPLAGLPLAALAIGAAYVYSAPGLAWMIGALGLWAAVELAIRARAGANLRAWAHGLAAPVAIAVAIAVAGVAPEAGRMLDFGGNVSAVAEGESAASPALRAQAAAGDAEGRRGARRELEFDDRLGNLFGDISPLEAGGVWPTGDFRVQPGDGSMPAAVFWLGAGLAVAAIGLGAFSLARRKSAGRAVLSAFTVAALIAAAGYAFSTPYTTVKLLGVLAPLAALVATAGTLGAPDRRLIALGTAFLAAAGLSSILALANAPVGPTTYSTGLAELRPTVEGRSTLVLADRGFLENERGREFLVWELRGARPLCAEPTEGAVAAADQAPRGIRRVITTAGEERSPYPGFESVAVAGAAELWRGPVRGRGRPESTPGAPTECTFVAAR